jgi:pyruvate kinase
MGLQLRRTKIVCTIGPATSSPERLGQLIEAGMDVARLNFSHGSYAEHAAVITALRAASAHLNRPIAILQDLQGPKIRTGTLQDHRPVTLTDGAPITITTREVVGTAALLNTTYADLPGDVKAGDRILLSDGLIELRVTAVAPPDIECQIVHGGTLAEHQGINLPGVSVSAPALTAKDREDLAFGVAQGVDYIALSFVRQPADLEAAHAAITFEQAKYGTTASPIPLIVKIEKPEAVEHLDAILAASNGVMVARGDLGVEMPLEQVPLIQKRIIKRANDMEIPVITATQMLESMITNPRPTRAEVSDVANAILDGTDAVMLSGETAVGQFPVETVRVMSRIACETEANGRTARMFSDHETTAAQAISHAARALADQARVKCIVVFTRSGSSAHLISKDRPAMPILALTSDETVLRQLPLWWGVTPRQSNLMETTEALITWVDMYMQIEGMAQRGDYIVIMGGMPVARKAKTNFVKLHRVGDA